MQGAQKHGRSSQKQVRFPHSFPRFAPLFGIRLLSRSGSKLDLQAGSWHNKTQAPRTAKTEKTQDGQVACCMKTQPFGTFNASGAAVLISMASC
jgi:hypothetical protein